MLKSLFASAYCLAREVGIDARRLALFTHLPRYVRDVVAWRKGGGRVDRLHPCLADWSDAAGSTSSAYFQQDLLVAQAIFAARPRRHVDVGSRIDGFVAHVAVFREIEVIDLRPLPPTIRNVRFLQYDVMRGADPPLTECTDSLSCLHALEHFGLGRYGDRLDPQGHLKGFNTLIAMLQRGGVLYLSFPVGGATVEFNAHRIFDPMEVLEWPGADALTLTRFDLVDPAGVLHEAWPLDTGGIALVREMQTACGIYTFRKA
jgi:hypothetical protein